MENLHGTNHNLFWFKCSSRLNCEEELVVVLCDLDSFFDAKVLYILHTLLAKTTVLSVFDVNDLSLLVELVYIPWALFNQGFSLLLSQLFVENFLI